MSRGLCVGTLGTLLFAGPFLGASWAQNKVEPGPPFPGGADITFLTTEEPFMSEQQRDYFRGKLLAWKDDVLKEAKDTLQFLQEAERIEPDAVDRAAFGDRPRDRMRARDRQRKLIVKIDAALSRSCEETGEPISINAWRRARSRPSRSGPGTSRAPRAHLSRRLMLFLRCGQKLVEEGGINE